MNIIINFVDRLVNIVIKNTVRCIDQLGMKILKLFCQFRSFLAKLPTPNNFQVLFAQRCHLSVFDVLFARMQQDFSLANSKSLTQ